MNKFKVNDKIKHKHGKTIVVVTEVIPMLNGYAYLLKSGGHIWCDNDNQIEHDYEIAANAI